jgi:Family of unknown function (DUF6427)
MLRLFLGNQFVALLFLPLVVGLYFVLNQFTEYFELFPEIDFGCWGTYVFLQYNWANYISFPIVIINAIGANYVFNSNEFHDKNTYVISLFYVVFLSFFQCFYQANGVLLAHSAIISGLFQVFRLDYNKDGRRAVFNSGFLFGLATTFHPPYIIFLPVVSWMILRIRPFVLREFLLTIVGYIIPLLYGVCFLYGFMHKKLRFETLSEGNHLVKKEMFVSISLAIFAIIGLFSLIVLSNKSGKSSIRFKKMISVLKLLFFAIILLGLMEFVMFKGYEWISLIVVPIVFFYPFSFFNKSSHFLGSLIFYLSFIFSIAKFFIN